MISFSKGYKRANDQDDGFNDLVSNLFPTPTNREVSNQTALPSLHKGTGNKFLNSSMGRLGTIYSS